MPSDTLTVWLVEDDVLYRQALVALLDGADGVRVGAAFGAAEPALDALHAAVAHEEAPDVLVSDIGLPGLLGTEAVRRAKALAPALQVVMLTIHEDEDRLFEALCAGASGYLLKSASAEQVLRAVREVHAGGAPFTPPMARKVLGHFRQAPVADGPALTEREREVLRLLADGHTQRGIAEALFLSPHTVDTHLRHVYEKLHVRTAPAAVSKALRERLIR
ncbi:MAG TPA: response regulator transcription factor [Rubricoccaceae bacterium]|nr:response regulator transcription factor [Rubricoccaceae bacterium]